MVFGLGFARINSPRASKWLLFATVSRSSGISMVEATYQIPGCLSMRNQLPMVIL